jgi:hypothetical protein
MTAALFRAHHPSFDRAHYSHHLSMREASASGHPALKEQLVVTYQTQTPKGQSEITTAVSKIQNASVAEGKGSGMQNAHSEVMSQ